MKILGNYKFWILLIFGLSLYIIISIELGYLPLIPSFIPEDTEKFNRIFLSIGYSLFAAVVFYYFSVVFPRQIQIRRNKQISGKEVRNLLYELFVLIKQILFVFEIEKDLKEIDERDLLSLNGNSTKEYIGYYRTETFYNTLWEKRKKLKGLSEVSFEFPESVIFSLSIIPKTIKQIRESNPNFYIDPQFSEILSSIETNNLIKWYANKEYSFLLFQDSSEAFYSLIQDYIRLKKLGYQQLKVYFEIYFYNDAEKKEIKGKNKIKDFLTERINMETKKEILQPLLIFNSENENFEVFKHQSTIDSIKIVDYKKVTDYDSLNRCIIIFSEGIPKIKMKEFIKGYRNRELLIIIQPSLFFSSKSKKFNGVSIKRGIYFIQYKSSYLLFNKKRPNKSDSAQINNIIYEILKNYTSEN